MKVSLEARGSMWWLSGVLLRCVTSCGSDRHEARSQHTNVSIFSHDAEQTCIGLGAVLPRMGKKEKRI